MEFILKNIGIIEKAEIKIPGLTVITGKNSSGKSTVGKALFAVVDGGLKIPEKYDADQEITINSTFNDIYRQMAELRTVVKISQINEQERSDLKDVFHDYPALWDLINSSFHASFSEPDKMVQELKDELNGINVDELLERINDVRKDYGQRMQPFRRERDIKSAFQEAERMLDPLLKQMSDAPAYDDYAKMNINDVLRKEFLGQIQPVSRKVNQSEIVLKNGGNLVQAEIKNNNVSSLSLGNIDSQIDRIILIDDPLILNTIDKSNSHIGSETNTVVHYISRHVNDHEEALGDLLQTAGGKTVLERTEINRKIERLSQKLEAMVPGEIYSDDSGDYLINNDGIKIRITNLATGAKIIALLQVLLKNGLITDKTILILDEPESHLHPEWQNMFAEIIILMMKELHTRIVMTTHSPNFFYALDTYADQYKLRDKCAFYQAESNDDCAVIHDVSNNVGTIYDDFLKYLIQMRKIRNDTDE